MTPALLPLLALLWGTPAAPPAEARTEKAAASYEEAAFVAIDDARWCDAARLFLQAETLAPNPTLLVNAAEAALEAGDRQLAVELLERATKRSTRRATKRKVKRRLRTVRRQLKKKGSPVVCDLAFQPLPEPSAPADEEPSAASPAPGPEGQPADAAATDKASTGESPDQHDATSDGGQTDTGATAPKTAAAAVPADRTSDGETASAAEASEAEATSAGGGLGIWPPLVGGALVVVGALAAVSGGAAALAGGWPYVGHTMARQGLEDAAAAGTTGDEVAALQDAQTSHRANWESWGLPMLLVGTGALVVGAAVVMGGSALVVSGLLLGGDGEDAE